MDDTENSSAVFGGGVVKQESTQPPTTAGSATPDITDVPSQYTQLGEETMNRVLEKATSFEFENEYVLTDTELYSIYVISHAEFFNVILKQFPYREGQEAAEQYLSEALGVSRAELCSLNIDVIAPIEFDQTQTIDLGLSECPGPRARGNI